MTNEEQELLIAYLVDAGEIFPDLDVDVEDQFLNQYQGGMCISGRLTMTERTPRHLISPLGPNWVGTDSAV